MSEEYTFNGQRRGERISTVVKNHPFVLLWPGIQFVLMAVVGIAVILFWSNQLSGPIAMVFFAVGAGLFFRHYYTYNQSVFIITSQRVIYVDQRGFWTRKIVETELSQIQEVSSDTSGVVKTIVHFGDLHIKTAGTSQGGEIVVKNIARPYDVQQKIKGVK